ncbi:MAG: hypothetical protein HC837_03235 [Chloroflexaceae bacterium]|nr:hypothetical protein [Chloroflexaceae bacterium]
MYIRWVVRHHKNATVANTSFHDAYLVESYRDERRRPRQRIICYLGNIRQIDADFPAIERELFLLRAERILHNITDLDDENRSMIMDLLYQKVRPLDRDEVIAAFTENLRWYRHWWKQHGGGLSQEELLRLIVEDNDTPSSW